MSQVRRLAAAVLLILIVPSLALAAMPLRYCLGSAGHQAIEFVIDGIAHGGSHASHEEALDDVADCYAGGRSTVFVDEIKCTDKSIIDSASAPPAIDLKQLLSASIVMQTSASFVAPPRPRSHSESRCFQCDLVVDPRIEVRRTTVLLI